MSGNGIVAANRGMPTGWAWASLGELGSWTGGGTPRKSEPSYWDGPVPWVSPKDMKSIRIPDTQDHISTAAIEESATKLFPANSIAFVTRSGILEHTLPIALVPFEATANQDMKVLTPVEDLNPEWLLYALLGAAPDIRKTCRKDGTTVASIDFARLLAYKLGVPERKEQDRIVATTRSLLSQLDAGNRQLISSRAELKRLRTSALHHLTSGADSRRLDEIGEVFVGATPKRDSAVNWNGDIPWVSSSEVAFCRIAQTRESITEVALGDRSRRLHPPDTILLAMYGEGKTRGQAAVLDVAAATNQAVAAIRIDRRVALPEFVYYSVMARYAEVRQGGQGGQQINLNKELVKAIEIGCPQLPQQKEAVTRIRAALSRIDELAAELDASANLSAALERSVLLSASRGWPDDSTRRRLHPSAQAAFGR